MKKYEIEIILDKEEISTEFKIICWKEIYRGNKRGAIKERNNYKKNGTLNCIIYMR